MKVFTCTDHDGHWPVGISVVVVAPSLDDAKRVLDEALRGDGLKPVAEGEYTLNLVDTTIANAVVHHDRNYRQTRRGRGGDEQYRGAGRSTKIV